MASDRGTASQLQALPELLQRHGDLIKPLIKPLIASLCTTFDFNERNIIEDVPIDLANRYYLPTELRALLVQEITKCVENYLTYNTYDGAFDPSYSIMNRFINEDPKDAPWAPGLNQKDNHEDDTRALASKNLLQQVAEGAGGSGSWGTDMGLRTTKRTREQNSNTLMEQRVESTQRIITQGTSEFLDPKKGLFPRAMSATGVMDQNIHIPTIKPRRCSSYIDGSTKPRSTKRRTSPGKNGKGLSTTGTGTPSRMQSTSAGSTKSTRREPKEHKCPDCGGVFQFEARLKSHQAVHSKNKCICPQCDSLFGRDSSLKRHLNTPGACQKKKDARLRNASFQNPSVAATRSGSQHNYYGMDAAASTSSIIDGTSVNDSPLDARHSAQSFNQRPNYSLGFDISQSQGSNSANYGDYYQNINSHPRPGGNEWGLDPSAYPWDCGAFGLYD